MVIDINEDLVVGDIIQIEDEAIKEGYYRVIGIQRIAGQSEKVLRLEKVHQPIESL